MKRCREKALLIVALFATGAAGQLALAQISIPTPFVRLPSSDFVWPWGRPMRQDARERPEFTLYGNEANFTCTLTGAFRLGSRMRDFAEQREFEQRLSSTLYFIQEATAWLNYYYRTNDLQWAELNCVIPDTEVSEDKEQERLDRALERAERQRERRRRRSGDD